MLQAVLGYQLRDRNIQFSLDVRRFLHVYAREADVLHILLNVINNAVEAVSRQSDPALTIETDTEDQDVIIFVSDNGPGLSDDDCQRACDPQFTAWSHDSKEARQSRGYGLTIAMICV